MNTESDSRFPSGKWIGFFLDRRMPGRHQMEATLTFQSGKLSGEGRDRVGEFVFEGTYSVEDGKCSWIKKYIGQHSIHYNGYNEGKGIWGIWEYRGGGWTVSGGFHIWPEAMGDPTRPVLHEEADEPIEYQIEIEEIEFVPARK